MKSVTTTTKVLKPPDWEANQRKSFLENALNPVIGYAENAIRVMEAFPVNELTKNQKRTLIVYQELIQLRGDVNQIPINEAYDRFNKIIKRNPATKRTVHRSYVRPWWKAIFRRMRGAGRNSDSEKDKVG